MYTHNPEIKLDTIPVGSIEGEFTVPSYQRGYRWGVDEVKMLLDDMEANGSRSYCLQPVVVKKNEDKYELIDGQQRLTTLFILLQYIKKEYKQCIGIKIDIKYSISYDITVGLGEYLLDIKEELSETDSDYFHIYQAYKTIDEWFRGKENGVKTAGEIYRSLSEYVKIIWYEIPGDSEDAIGLFTRLNIGKIPLTNAELVKAMFLTETNLEGSGKDAQLEQKLHEARQNEISTQWDMIEKELHDENFWRFLTNSGSERYKTRIDLVLDLIVGTPGDCREKYYTFFQLKEKKLSEVWQKIQHKFLLLKDWYEDHDFYHKIGYLIASEYEGGTLQDIFRLSEGKTKKEFKDELDELIRESIKIDANYADLDYHNDQHRKKITRLLLLFNVESVYQMDGKTQRFPFHQYKSFTSGKVVWSLEHIHAQHSEGLKTKEQWKLWLEMHKDSVKTVAKDKTELIKEMEDAIGRAKLTGEEFEDIYQKILEVLSEKGEMSMHSIANLTLLNTADNAVLSNATFDVKRNEIIRMDKAGQYIPFCTKMVFLKYYTTSEKNQLHFWGREDRMEYIENINRVLGKYLQEKIYTDDEMKNIKAKGNE